MGTRAAVRLGLFAAAGLLSFACATSIPTTGIIKMSADTYRLSRVDPGGQYPDAEAMRAAVTAEADAFAKGQGKVAVPIATHQETMRVGHLTTIDYEFRLASPRELPAKAAAAPPQPAVIEAAKPAASPAAEPKPTQPMSAELYNELIRLDDLRKRGILTDEEFRILKNQLIGGH